MALQLPLFPIDQPVMPESRQIGRQPTIDRLHQRVEAVVHQWLVGQRRIGKTSVAKAVLVRLRETGAMALEVDLNRLDARTAEGLAGELARQAQAAGVGASVPRRLFDKLGRQAAQADHVGLLLQALGAEEAGQALSASAGLLAGADGGEPGLDHVLGALALHARATARRVVVLLDEVHHLAEVEHGERDVARWARETDSPIIFVLAGSEAAAIGALRDVDRPLAAVGQHFELPEISTTDWLHGLELRFQEAEVAIGRREILSIVEASDGHPRRTMLVATYVHAAALEQDDHAASRTLVALAIADAQRDLAWT